MTIKITNQTPAVIYHPHEILPRTGIGLSADEYIEKQKEYIKDQIVEPLFNPLNAQNAVLMEDVSDPANPINFDKDAITEGIWHLWTSDTVDSNLDRQLTSVYYQSLLHTQDNNWRIENQQGLEALSQLGLPLPSTGQGGQMVTYTPRLDIIPTAKQLLANPSDSDLVIEWFAHLTGFIYNKLTNTALVTVQSSHAWSQIKQRVDTLRQTLNQQAVLDQGTNTLLSEFNDIDLDGELSAGIFMPQSDQELPHSFTRIIMNMLSIYEDNNADELFVQPINTMELVLPRNLIVLNLEEYAHATDREIIDDWNDLENAFTVQSRLKMTSLKKLMTAKKINAATAPTTDYRRDPRQPSTRRTQRPFSDKPITSKKMLYLMERVINRTTTQKQTENTYKTSKNTFMRPNRRDPNNINLMGKVSKVSYRPDVHIYLDTSGSIDETQYRDAVASIIMLTRKIDANLYISSFSHEISQTSLLRTKNKSLKAAYQDFLRIPKVGGGTEFENVWNKIDQLDILNQRAGKSYQLNFVITDFGYGLRRDRRFHRESPSHKYTYYVPISTDPRNWSHITRMAKRFSEQMASAGAKGIRKHLLM